ncbi:MAG: hypothetical protein LBH57_06840, partial [Treponema sp.]|nr:hypothetical protein [Treponema sp.]
GNRQQATGNRQQATGNRQLWKRFWRCQVPRNLIFSLFSNSVLQNTPPAKEFNLKSLDFTVKSLNFNPKSLVNTAFRDKAVGIGVNSLKRVLPAYVENIHKLTAGKTAKEQIMKKEYGAFFGFAVLVMTAIFTLAGCGDNGDPTSLAGGNPPAGPDTGGNPVLNSGEIWKDDERPTEGMRFENNNVYHYYLANGTWGSRSREGTWNGNTITRTGGPNSTFTVSGDKLYEYVSSGSPVATYTKTTGQTISGQTGGGGTENSAQLSGTWVKSGNYAIEFTIPAKTYKMGGWSANNFNGVPTQGTFTYLGTTLTFIVGQQSMAGTAAINGSTLALSGFGGQSDGTYTKHSGSSTDDNDPRSEYAEANFPALTGAGDFIGTWKSGSYTLQFIDNGTWTFSVSGFSGGRFLVSGNSIYIYLLESGRYYQNSYGNRSGPTITMNGGLAVFAESWTKQSSQLPGGNDDPGPGTSIASTYRGTFNGTVFSTDLTASRNNADFTITENTISWDHENSGGGVSGENYEGIPATGTIQNVSTNGGGNLTAPIVGTVMGTWTYIYSGNNKIGIARQDEDGDIDIYLGVNSVNLILMGLNVLGTNASSTGIAETVQEIHVSD